MKYCIILCLLVFIFAGCNSGPTEEEIQAAETQKQRETAKALKIASIQKAIEDFTTKEAPGWTVVGFSIETSYAYGFDEDESCFFHAHLTKGAEVKVISAVLSNFTKPGSKDRYWLVYKPDAIHLGTSELRTITKKEYEKGQDSPE